MYLAKRANSLASSGILLIVFPSQATRARNLTSSLDCAKRPNGQRQPLARVWEDPVANPNPRQQVSPELTARSASRLHAMVGPLMALQAISTRPLNWTLGR